MIIKRFKAQISKKLLALSLAFALCMGAFAGFSITSHASADAYNQLKAGLETIKEKDSYDTEDVQYVWFDSYLVNHPYELYCLLEQLTEDEYNQLAKDMEYNALFHYSDDTYKWSDKPEDKKSNLYEEYGTYSECMKYVGERKKKLEEEEKARQDAVSNATSQTDEAIPGYQNNQNASNENNEQNSGSSWQMNDDAITTKMSGGEIVNGSKLGFCEDYDFVKLPVGSEFQSSDGRIFRVTKEMSYRSFGEVQLIGYGSTDTKDVQHFGDGGDGILRAASNTALDIGDAITPNGNRYKDPNIDELRRNRRDDNEAYKAALKKQNDSITFNKYTESKNYIDIGNMLADISFGRDAKTGEQYYTYHSVYFVTSIKSGAFKNNKDLEEVWIPQTVSEITKECFSGCTNLKTVHWGTNTLKNLKGDEFFSKASVKYNSKRKIAVKAFNGCKKLSTFYLVGSDKDIKVEKNAFKNCKTITVKSYKKNKYAKKFAKAISSKGKAKKNASLTNKKVTGMTDDGETATIKGKSKKSSKKKK